MTYQPEVLESDLPTIKQWIDEGNFKAAGEALKIYLLDHEDIGGIYLLGTVFMGVEHYGLAKILFERALQEDNRWQHWFSLGRACDHLNKQDEAEKCYREALKQEPDNLSLLGALGSNLVHQYRSEEAIEISNKTLGLYPNDGRSISNRGFAYLQLKDYGNAWADYEAGLGNLKWRVKKNYQGEHYWDGTKGQKLYVYTEQGVGDQLASCEPLRDLVKDCDVKTLDCGPKIKNLLQRSFPDIKVKGDLFKQSAEWHLDHKIDASCSMFSVHRYYRKKESDYPKKPYLVADQERRIQWRALLDSLGNKMKVGIAWSGGVSLTKRAERSCSLETFLPILSQDCTFINLEYRDREGEVEEFKQKTGIKIHSWPWALQSEDYDDTAALVAELDLIVTVPTSIVHLAGGLGVDTICMVHTTPNIHYARDGDSMPYYGCVKLLRHPDDLKIGVEMAAKELNLRNHNGQLRRIA